MAQGTTGNVGVEYIIGQNWIHTHGMHEAGFPELEMRGIPAFLAPPAAELLNDVCAYMLREGRRVAAGETMNSSGAVFRFVSPVPMPGDEDHYEVERLQLVDVGHACECCGEPLINIADDQEESDEPAHVVEVVTETWHDGELSERLAGLAVSHGGDSLGSHWDIVKEEVEIEEFGFDSGEAAEAFIQAILLDDGVRYANVLTL